MIFIYFFVIIQVFSEENFVFGFLSFYASFYLFIFSIFIFRTSLKITLLRDSLG